MTLKYYWFKVNFLVSYMAIFGTLKNVLWRLCFLVRFGLNSFLNSGRYFVDSLKILVYLT